MPAPADLARRIDVLGAGPQHRVLGLPPAPVTGRRFCRGWPGRSCRSSVSRRWRSRRPVGCPVAIHNARVLCEDGLAPARSMGLFDRIIMHLSVEDPPMAVLDLLAPGGVMVFGGLSRERARPAPGFRRLRRERSANGEMFSETEGPLPLERRHRRAGAFFVNN